MLGILWILNSILTLFGTWLSLRYFLNKSSPRDCSKKINEGISILKPLKGLDPGLEENLKSFFNLEDIQYELIFSVASRSDPAYEIANQLIAQYPHCKAKIIVGRRHECLNPKVENLLDAYADAQFDLVMISDSNTRVQPHFVADMASLLESDTGVVTAPVRGSFAKGLGGLLEANHLHTFYARWLILADWMGFPCVIGKAMIFRKKVAQRFGGLQALSNYLAEDYMTGIAMKRLGLKVKIFNQPVTQTIGNVSVSYFWNRHLRWGIIRKAHAPLAFLGEFFSGSIAVGLLGFFALNSLGLQIQILFLILHLCFWASQDFLISQRFSQRQNQFSFLGVWAVREFMMPFLWMQSILSNTVNWRGQRFTLGAWGILKA